MGHYNICRAKIVYNMGDRDNAADALYDVCEAPLLYDRTLECVRTVGEPYTIKADNLEEELRREWFHLMVSTDSFRRCTVTGWSDMEQTRKVEVTWEPEKDPGALVLTLHAGLPIGGWEYRVVDVIQSSWPENDIKY